MISNVLAFGLPVGPEILIILLFIIPLFLIFPSYWVYKDAHSRGMNAAVWAVATLALGFLAPIFGTIAIIALYLLVRD